MKRFLLAATSVLSVAVLAGGPVATTTDPAPVALLAPDSDVILEGLPLTVYGHSIAAGQGATGNASWVNRLAGRHRMATANRAVCGDLSAQTVGRLIGTTGTPWTHANGVVVLQDALNDVRRYGVTAAGLNGFANNLTAMLATLTASSRIESTGTAGFAYSGSWATTAYPWASAGDLRYTSTVGAWVDVTFTGDSLNLMLWVLASDSPQVFFADADGTVIRTRTYAETGGGGSVNATPVLERFTGYGAGQHTIRMYHDQGPGNIYVDAQLPESAAPPQVLVVKDPGIIAWDLYAPFDQGSAAALDAYNDAIDTVAAGFPNVTVVTVPGWDLATMAGPDGVHPNERGHAQIADAVEQALRAAVPDYRPGVHSR